MFSPESFSQNPESPRASREVVLQFVSACGLSKRALSRLRVEDVIHYAEGDLQINVNDPDGVPIYEVPVLRGQEQHILRVVAGRSPEDLVFPRLPEPLYLQRARVRYARGLFYQVLASQDFLYDEDSAAFYVMHALCEPNRIDMVRRYYLGLPPRGPEAEGQPDPRPSIRPHSAASCRRARVPASRKTSRQFPENRSGGWWEEPW